jgi:thiamine kinase-like enzyme
LSDERLLQACRGLEHEIIPSIKLFKPAILELAATLSVNNTGPFPRCHGDFGHNNIVIDDQYNILSVIDWEMAYAAPWEVFADFPLTLTMIPRAMDAP